MSKQCRSRSDISVDPLERSDQGLHCLPINLLLKCPIWRNLKMENVAMETMRCPKCYDKW